MMNNFTNNSLFNVPPPFLAATKLSSSHAESDWRAKCPLLSKAVVTS